MDTLGEFADHVAWMRASVEWFLAQDRSGFDIPVENCPGWDVGFVYDHVGMGLGVSWTEWIEGPADVDGAASIARRPEGVSGSAGYDRMVEYAPLYLAAIDAVDPDKECFWWFGPRSAAYLVLLGTTETEVHRCDVADALGVPRGSDAQRCGDGLVITTEFFGDRWRVRGGEGGVPQPIRLDPADTGQSLVLGDGEPVATVSGAASDLLMRLWGRPAHGEISVEGDPDAFEAWTRTSPGL